MKIGSKLKIPGKSYLHEVICVRGNGEAVWTRQCGQLHWIIVRELPDDTTITD
jgi:hypothetical protein